MQGVSQPVCAAVIAVVCNQKAFALETDGQQGSFACGDLGWKRVLGELLGGLRRAVSRDRSVVARLRGCCKVLSCGRERSEG